jgi:hypothetical protein
MTESRGKRSKKAEYTKIVPQVLQVTTMGVLRKYTKIVPQVVAGYYHGSFA